MTKHFGEDFKNMSRGGKILTITIVVLITIGAVISFYKSAKNHLLDRKEYKASVSSVAEASASFSSNDDMKAWITSWADENKLEYTVDGAGNIIFVKDASSDKSNVAPVVVCTSYNWQTAAANSESLASAFMIAKSELDAGKYSVILFNDEFNMGKGYQAISPSYFTDDTKLVYLDTGDKSYISVDAFAFEPNSITIPCESVPVKCDSAVKIRIDGITSGSIDSKIGSQPSPLNALSSVLTKLNNKSVTYQIADFKLYSQGNMYPTGMEVTILLNSYSMGTLTSYLDDRIKKFDKNYGDDYPDAVYEYNVIDNSSEFPALAYSDSAAKSLSMVLYTIKNGAYRFDKHNVPEDYEVDDVYAVNCIHNLTYDGSSLNLLIGTSALNDSYLKQILKENATAAEFADAQHTTGQSQPALKNNKSKLYKELQFAYVKVNEISSSNIIIKENRDSTFIPCSFLQNVNDKMDIVHLREDSINGAIYANTLLCFIKDQGNFLSL